MLKLHNMPVPKSLGYNSPITEKVKKQYVFVIFLYFSTKSILFLYHYLLFLSTIQLINNDDQSVLD